MDPLWGAEKGICFACQMSLPQTDHHLDYENLLWEKLNRHMPVSRAVALFDFQKYGKVESLLHQLKYNGQEQIRSFIGDWLGPELQRIWRIQEGPSGIAPAAPSPTTQAAGYNQVRLFSESLARHLGLPLVDDLVYRKKETRQLAKLGEADRWKEVASAFEVHKNHNYQSLHWLLVDDVITTGATLVSCGSSILETVGGSISIVSLASRLS
ncbi:MAG: ComF family protein [Flavobacteriia bacterium]|nr:ComF family protein [Flavobacteriia bacterium]